MVLAESTSRSDATNKQGFPALASGQVCHFFSSPYSSFFCCPFLVGLPSLLVMASMVDPVSAIESLPERKERLHKAFSELESTKSFLNITGIHWKDVEEYILDAEKTLRKTLEGYLAREKALNAKTEASKEDLEKREADVSSREQASLARVQEQKDAAVADILEQKRKWSEEKQALDAANKEKSGTKDGESKATNSHAEPAVKTTSAKPADVEIKAMEIDTKAAAGDAEDSPDKDPTAAPKQEIKPRPELMALCEAMDSVNLRLFIAEHRKELNAVSAELPYALRSAKDPSQLVLKVLDGYYPSEQNASQGAKKDATLPANRRACVILLEALADPIVRDSHSVISEEIKQSAKQFADLWKSKMNLDGELGSNIALDAQSFLQLLATFGLAPDYDQDELCKLITPIARRKQTPALCRDLGLSAKVPDIVDKLIKDGKQIEALSFANAFDLLDSFEPVSLLKSYLKEAKKVVQTTLKNGNNSAAAQNDANQKELAAMRAVLKAIGEYKLEDKYAPAPLEKRIAQLEKAKLDRKRSANVGKSEQTKRARTNNNGGLVSGNYERPSFRSSERAQYMGIGVSAYGAGSAQAGFDHHPLSVGHYPGYSAGNRSPISLPGSYLYDNLGYGSSAFINAPSSYNSYGYGSGLGTTPSGYQSYL